MSGLVRMARGIALAAAFASLAAAPAAHAAPLSALGGARAVKAAETTKAPKVTKQPASATVEEGQSATFVSTATGTPAPTAQWEVSTNAGASWSPLEGASSPTLTITGPTVSESGEQVCA